MRTNPGMLVLVIGATVGACQDSSSSPPAATEASITLSKAAWNYYQQYLSTRKPITFAVSKDGYSAYYIYCDFDECDRHQARLDALSQCAKIGHQQCIIFAELTKIVVPYKISGV